MDLGNMMLCISVAPGPGREGFRLLEEAFGIGDVVEIRLDKIMPSEVPPFSGVFRKPLLLTYRSKEQGGEGVDIEHRTHSILRAIGKMDAYVDVEYCWPKRVKAVFERYWTKKVILSHHILTHTPTVEELVRLYWDMAYSQPFAVKIVTYARSPEDNLTIKRFLSLGRINNTKVISFSMGPLGLLSRVLCVRWGSYMTFACLKGHEMAEGQLPGSIMRELLEESRAV